MLLDTFISTSVKKFLGKEFIPRFSQSSLTISPSIEEIDVCMDGSLPTFISKSKICCLISPNIFLISQRFSLSLSSFFLSLCVSLSVYLSLYIYIYIYIYMRERDIYIYIERERDRQTKRQTERDRKRTERERIFGKLRKYSEKSSNIFSI